MILFSRVWAMPNKTTFAIPPIKEFLENRILFGTWLDPFSGFNTSKELSSKNPNIRLDIITNDINPICAADYDIDAIDFLKLFSSKSVDGVLYDPPYSPRQVKEVYDSIGLEITQEDTRADKRRKTKEEIARVISPGGKVISFGWSSGGIGKKLGFELTEILLVAHGSGHNDTIVTVEVKK